MITGYTQLVAILADPIQQVRTPEFINAIYARQGDDILMVPVHVGAESLEQLWGALKVIQNFRGMVVTVPHKRVAASLCDEVTELASVVGAVNVIRKDKDGRFVGDILDGEGFYDGLLGQGIDPSGSEVLMVGAGGAGRAIAHALAKHGVSRLTITNRTVEKATDLATKLGKLFPALRVTGTDIPEGKFDLIINTTSLGMNESDPLPVDESLITADTIIADIIMKPRFTRLLKTARNKGCKVYLGESMLEAQSHKMAAFMKMED